MATKQALNIVRGKTTKLVIRWAQAGAVVSKPISALSASSGFPRLTVNAHGAPQGWPCYVSGVKSPKQINVTHKPPRASDYREVTVIDPNTVEFNGLLPVDDNGSDWQAYTSGGFLYYNAPKDLTGYVIRAKVKDKLGGTVLLSTEAGDSPLNLITATADNATKSITIEISAATSEDLSWDKGVWEVEGESPTGTVDSIIAPSPVTVGDEVVTS